MKKGMILVFLGLSIAVGWGNAYDLVPAAVSPGLAGGVALVRQSCPTFSWTSVSWALSYKVVVFEAAGKGAPAYETIAAQAAPILTKEIQGQALSWTPSASEGLANGGSYIWYVGAMVDSAQGRWSEGRHFLVAEGPVWDSEAQKRLIVTLQESGVSEEVSKKVLQEMNAGYTGRVVANFDLRGGSPYEVQGTEGSSNTLYGKYAGFSLTSGYCNSFIGRSAGYSTVSGSYNAFVGYVAGYYNTSSENTFLGCYAGYKNTSGYSNVFIGKGGGFSNTTGYYNTFLGYNAGYYNSTGIDNVFVGATAGYLNTTGSANVFIGKETGYKNTTGHDNTYVGNYSNYYLTSGYDNTAIGRQAAYYLTTGSKNTAIGLMAGYANATGQRNVYLGYKAGYYEHGSDKLYIANSDTGTPLVYGDFAAAYLNFNGKVGIAKSSTAAPTHKLDVGTSGAYCDGGAWVDGSSRTYKENIEALTSAEALQAVEELQPVKFNYKENKEEQYLGFIAEDVPSLVAMKDRKGLNAMDLVAMLTKVVQEQQKSIAELKEKIAKLEKGTLKDK